MGKATEYTRVAVDKLIPYANNAKQHSDGQVTKIASSIREFGFLNPVLIDASYNVIAGHGRILAAKKLQMDEVPCLFVEGLTEAQRKAYILADNRLSELGEWDMELVMNELTELDDLGFDTELTGFEFEVEPKITDDEDDIPEPPTEPKAKLGDLYQLGRHRLMCGDSTDPEMMAKLMGGEKAVFVFTDPPYGVSIGSKNKAINSVDPGKGGYIEEDIENDTMSEDDLYSMLVEAMTNLRKNCSEDCSYYVSSPQGGSLGMMMMMMMKDAGLPVRHILIWVKSSPCFSLGRLDYDYRHEPIFYTWTDKHAFYGGYGNTVIDDTTPLEKMSKAELKDLVRALKQQKEDSVIYCDKPHQNHLHPTMKPIKLIARFMINSSQADDVVLDIFGGSGSTLIAAEQLNRKCYTMEIDPHFVDVIIERWETFTGEKAVLLDE